MTETGVGAATHRAGGGPWVRVQAPGVHVAGLGEPRATKIVVLRTAGSQPASTDQPLRVSKHLSNTCYGLGMDLGAGFLTVGWHGPS